MLLVVLGAEVAAGEDEHHRVRALQLGEAAASLVLVGQLVVREDGTGDDVCAHGSLLASRVAAP
jgi:hypothetical protein